MSRAGYVLAGGRSARMGRDKALLPFRGRPLAESVAGAVAAAAGTAVLVGDPANLSSLGYRVIPDLYPGEGPLGGILTALHHTSADWNLITACDMPELTADFLAGLLAAAELSLQHGALPDGAFPHVVMPAGPSGIPEPLCAVYSRLARNTIDAAFAAGVRKITAALDGLVILRIAVPELKPFQNVNTPQDWAGYAAD